MLGFSGKSAFRYPAGGAPRIAVLVDWFAKPRKEVSLEEGPGAIIGTRAQLLALAPRALTHAAVVVSRQGEAMLTAADRDALWRAFKVPIFEQVIGERGRLLASECEAHDGLHVVDEKADWPGFSREEGPCGCGKTSRRIVVSAEKSLSAGSGGTL